MAENVQQSVEVPVGLSIFGSLYTEMSPSDLPEGISPDNQDIVYLPGSVGSRECLHRIYAGLPANTTSTYIKSFITPSGDVKNLMLMSDGSFWVEDFTNHRGVLASLANVAPGSYATSVTAFGREYIVFHDCKTGTDIPRQYDGTYFDRLTMDGPAAGPSVTCISLPSSQMVAVSGSSVGVNTIFASDPVTYYSGPSGGYRTIYTTLTFDLAAAPPGGLVQDASITISGNSQFNGTFGVQTILSTTSFKCGYYNANYLAGNGGLAATAGVTAQRSNNTVTVNTNTAHGLQVGFQARITGLPAAAIGGGITSIVIDNENFPGLATITTPQAHGLSPELYVSITGVQASAIGGGISAIVRAGEVVTVTTNSAHGLTSGATVTIAGVTDSSFDGSFVVTVTGPTTFVFNQADSANASSSAGTVSLVWPIADSTLLPQFFQVVACPTPTTFQIAFYYSDGTWTTGAISFAWNGTFYVTAVLSTTSFQYQQYGPDASTTSVGTVTPYGQLAPGPHQLVMMWLTRQGLISAPCPPIQFTSNGGQYLSLTNVPLGPPGVVVGRIFAITGADGDNFFYLDSPAQYRGIVVSTTTSIDDNTSTSCVVDVSDTTLFNGVAIDIPGNNLFELQTLSPCLGVFNYASRLLTWGLDNKIPNFVNMAFDGGYLSGGQYPLGWTVSGQAGGSITTSPSAFGMSWQLIGGIGGNISQSAFRDAYGVSILQPSTLYEVRFWAIFMANNGGDGDITFDIYSPSQGVLASSNFSTINLLPVAQERGAFYRVTLSAATPAVIPADAIFRIYHSIPLNSDVAIDEISVIPVNNPTLLTFQASYVDLPEAMDGITGTFGATDDNTPLQACFIHRDELKFMTFQGFYETSDQASVEPSGWRIRQVTSHCGAASPRCCTSGENFSVWVSAPSSYPPTGRGLYIYTGGDTYKISQEIQPDFDQVNPEAAQTIWTKLDPVKRRIYVGLPLGAATAPNRIYVLDYRELDVASELASRPPIHISFTGKMICSDLSRKWTRWNVAANCGELFVTPSGVQFSVGGGNGQAPGASGYSNVYWFDSSKMTDDDYGQVNPYYTTYFFVNHEMEQMIQVGLHRKLYKRYAAYITGTGQMFIQPYGDALTNPWPQPPMWPLFTQQNYDIGDGLNVLSARAAFKIGSVPLAGQTDNGFVLQKLIITLMQEPVAPLRFGAV